MTGETGKKEGRGKERVGPEGESEGQERENGRGREGTLAKKEHRRDDKKT